VGSKGHRGLAPPVGALDPSPKNKERRRQGGGPRKRGLERSNSPPDGSLALNQRASPNNNRGTPANDNRFHEDMGRVMRPVKFTAGCDPPPRDHQ